MRASLSYESIPYLAFTRLPLPIGLSSIVACFPACLTFGGVGESLGLHSSHLTSLGWVLLGYGPFFFNSAPVSSYFWFMG